jgi:hypothetical protein
LLGRGGVARQYFQLAETLEGLEVVGADLVRLLQRRARHLEIVLLDEHLGVLEVVEAGLRGQAVERVQRGETAKHLGRVERQPRHLLAHRDRVLVEALLLVARDGLVVATLRLSGLALFVEQVGEQHAVIGVRIAGRHELLVFRERAVEVPIENAALRAALDLDRLFQVGCLPGAGADPRIPSNP